MARSSPLRSKPSNTVPVTSHSPIPYASASVNSPLSSASAGESSPRVAARASKSEQASAARSSSAAAGVRPASTRAELTCAGGGGEAQEEAGMRLGLTMAGRGRAVMQAERCASIRARRF
eukprot:scaffold2786_cov96-Isochrysis_galbana.AAC.1